MQPKDSVLYSQEPTNRPHSEPTEYNQCLHNLFLLEIRFNIIPQYKIKWRILPRYLQNIKKQLVSCMHIVKKFLDQRFIMLKSWKANQFLLAIFFPVAVQPLQGLGLLFRFRNLLYTYGRTPWMSDQLIARPLPTQDNTNKTYTYT
jgi:hypothetical protein